MPDTVYLTFCTCPDSTTAESLSEALVTEGLAACVNIVPGLVSVYRWQGKIEKDNECLLLIKTTEERVPELTARVRQLHPYDEPEVIAHPIVTGSDSYLEWVRTCTARSQ
ncbi:MAG: divalent-cation tolerance protein CutA [Thiohalocapsa sp.]|nr:divalent-cation tolerance protein CutA [Thiohalocapsa sp.]